ncbi:M10 family metallopeptidase C-terminal domain-containing protein [Azospirillum sp. TSA2s]|uniref:M10 family metallopeptidase C-terminal domain-containing protein n=1 Tax=Azospirillum sp. TSA2s TaxID=709810 RepID=UPI00200048B2|nr:M10 family metallopeptidase C-terminal domain-containing protein [Azospirillum sp. TSA2s]
MPASTVQALLATGTPRWGGGGVGSGATVTYSFLEQAPSYASPSDTTGFAPLSAMQRDAVRQAFAAWTAVATIVFVETSESANSGQGGSIRIGTNRQSSSAAYAYYPTGSLYDTGGDIYLANTTATNTSPTPGTYGYLTILHEIGHAIGLKHPGNYNATGGGGEPPYLSSTEDNYRYTLMSYNRHPSLGLNGLATGPALYDIAAAQYLYGANTGTRIGDDRYVFASTTTPFSQAIWDAGGTDSIDAGGQVSAVIIDLTPGAFSSIGPNGSGGRAVENVSIAYGAIVENAIGGAGDDILIGNAAGNVLAGGGGNDTLTGDGGNDSLVGGEGTDIAVFSGSRADYSITADSGEAVITHLTGGSDGTDRLTGVEYAQFADQRVGLLPPVVTALNRTLTLGAAVGAGALVSASDPLGGAITRYELVDRTADHGHLTLNGVEQPVGDVLSVSAAGLAGVAFVGSALGTDRLELRAFNGTLWSPWIGLDVTTLPANRPPVVEADKRLVLEEGDPATPLGLLAPSDPDGDPLTITVTGLPGSGILRLADGRAVTATTPLTAESLAGLTYTPATGLSGGAGGFSYRADDGAGHAAQQTVALTVESLASRLAGFNPFVYLASYPDLTAAFGLNAEAARAHYIQYGRFEGRAAASFNAMAYLASNSDVAAAVGIDATETAKHYLSYGRTEGRGWSGFDPLAYTASYADLAAAFGTDTVRVTQHYITTGRAEGRTISPGALTAITAQGEGVLAAVAAPPLTTPDALRRDGAMGSGLLAGFA